MFVIVCSCLVNHDSQKLFSYRPLVYCTHRANYIIILEVLFPARSDDKSIPVSVRAAKKATRQRANLHDRAKMRQIKRAFLASSICVHEFPTVVTKSLVPRKRLLYLLVLSLSTPLSLSLSLLLSLSPFCAAQCSSGKRAHDEEGGKGTRALLINYSVGVAPLKIKIGSLSGATWNFFLNRREKGAGSDDGYRFSTFVKEGRATSEKTVGRIVCSDRQSPLPFGTLNGPDEAATLFIPRAQ